MEISHLFIAIGVRLNRKFIVPQSATSWRCGIYQLSLKHKLTLSKTKKIEFDLLENGLDFILNSLKPILESKDEHDLKYSVLHISAGTELILKEILRTEHWSLIFEKVDSANRSALKSGDFQSASFETIIIRLQKVVDIDIPMQAIRYFRELRKKRNRIEHFAFQESDVAIKSNVSKVLSHLLELIKDNIEIKEYSKKSQDLFKNILKSSALFGEFTSLTYSKLKVRLDVLRKDDINIVECPECFQKTLPLDGDFECLFCGYNDDPESIAYLYIENILGLNEYTEIKDGGYFPLEDCPECGTHTLLVKDDGFLCFNCGDEWSEEELRTCDCCNGYYAEKVEDLGMCDDCRSEQEKKFMEQYD